LKKKRITTFSGKIVISISIIFSILIIATALSFSHVTEQNALFLKKILVENNNDLLLDKTGIIIEKLYGRKANSRKKLNSSIREICSGDRNYLYAAIFKKTADENYFKLTDKIPLSKHFRFNLKKGNVVQESKQSKYLQKGQLHGIVEPEIYADSSYTWQNIYYPFVMKNRKFIIRFMAASNISRRSVNNFQESVNETRNLMVIISSILAAAVFVLTIIFMNNYNSLVKNLSKYMKKAAEGNLDININTTNDSELNELALSFNSLIEEIKDIKDTEAPRNDDEPGEPEKTPAREELSNIFNLGVSMLKKNKLDDATALFKTLTIVKPEGFGSYFNLGVAYAKTKQYSLSLDMFRKAKLANPSHEITDKYILKVEKIISQNGYPTEN